MQFFAETVFNEVAFSLTNLGIDRELIRESVEAVLKKVGFEKDSNQSPFRLSGGQQRRIAIASILVTNPGILLLDEPTVGMDQDGISMLRRIIAEYRQSQGIVIIASHDQDFLYREANRFLVLSEGKLAADFGKEHYLNFLELLGELGIDIPEIIQLKQNRQLPVKIMEELA
jgi:energy-coupling factor transport system ATP-binding protein